MTTSLHPLLEARLRRAHDSLSSQGSLLPPYRIEAASDEFRNRFGSGILASLDGVDLLETMHGRGGEGESMVFWLEYKNDGIFQGHSFGSIKGGGAQKFGIFRRRDSGEWADSAGRTITQEQAIAQATEQRRELEQCAAFLSTVSRDTTDDLFWLDAQITMARLAPELHRSVWAHKYLTVLFPDLLENYHRANWQRHHLLKLLQQPPRPPDHPVDVARDLFLCTGRFTGLARYFGWPLQHLTAVLNAVNGRPHRYWRVGTSIEEIDAWPHMHEGGYAAIGWSQLGDLSEFVDTPQRRDLIRQSLPQCGYYENDARLASRKAGEISNFIGVIENNDVIAAANGQQLRGLGKVTGGYYHDDSTPKDAPHRLPVKWLVTDEAQLFQSKEGLLTSVYNLTDEGLILEIERAIIHLAPFPTTIFPADFEGEVADDPFSDESSGAPGPDLGSGNTHPPSSHPASPVGDLPEPPPGPGATPGADSEPDSELGQPSILSEQPTDKDALGIAPYARGLAAFLSSPHTQTPVTVSIEGPWGIGKSSFLKMVGKELQAPPQGTHRKIVRFNPWRHDAGESLWAAFLYEFAEQTEKALSFIPRQKARLRFYWAAIGDRFRYQTCLLAFLLLLALAIWREWLPVPGNWDGTTSSLVAIFVALCPVAGIIVDYIKGLRKDAEKVWKKDDEKERVCAAEKASDRFRKFLAAYLGQNERIYVILDDLDRCAAPKAAELLDSLQLLISGNGNESGPFPVVFLLALDREKVAAGVAVKFKELLPFVGQGLPTESERCVEVGRDFGYEYLQKFIDVPFRLPAAGPNGIATYIEALAKDADPDHEDSASTSGTNPLLRRSSAASGGLLNDGTDDFHVEKEVEKDEEEENPSDDSPSSGDTVKKLDERVSRRIKNNLDLVRAMTAVAPMLDNNPRRLKQYLNLLRLRAYLIEAAKPFGRNDVLVAHLAKTVAIELARPVLYRHLCEDKQLRDQFATTIASIIAADPGSLAQTNPPEFLSHCLGNLGREDLGWVKRHIEPLTTRFGEHSKRFPSEDDLDILLHISRPPAEAEAKAATLPSP